MFYQEQALEQTQARQRDYISWLAWKHVATTLTELGQGILGRWSSSSLRNRGLGFSADTVDPVTWIRRKSWWMFKTRVMCVPSCVSLGLT